MKISRGTKRLINARDRNMSQVMRLLKAKDPALFERYMTKFKRAGYKPLGQTDWSKVGSDTVDLLTQVYASKELDKSEKKLLELKLKETEAQNKAIDKQIALEKAKGSNIMAQATALSKENFFSRNPMVAFGAVGLGLASLFFLRKKRR